MTFLEATYSAPVSPWLLRRSKKWSLYIVALLFATLLPTPPTCASDAFGIPVSEKLIVGRLLFPDGTSGLFAVQEGSLLKIREGNRAVGLSPLYKPGKRYRDTWDFEFLAVDITTLPSGGEAVYEDGVFWAQTGKLTAAPTKISMDVEMIGVVEDGSLTPLLLSNLVDLTHEDLEALLGKSSCCVQCAGREICGSVVVLSCGSCCTGTECGIGAIDQTSLRALSP